ncbi:MAG: TetR/AcrR family transcriptional regulator [Syntrophomonadaceae bacterium]|nr:TetR/AcrR family transcriptional regulator [Syntrophomonadaceae bacterium]
MKERIINACRELALSRGLYSFTVDELAAQAGVSKRTIYRYFKSKDEIVGETLDLFLESMAEQLEEIIRSEHDVRVMINRILEQLLFRGQFLFNGRGLNDLRIYYPQLWEKIDKFRIGKMELLIQTILTKSASERTAEIDPRIITAVIVGAVQAVINPDFILENGFTFEEATQQLSGILMMLLADNC